MSHVDLLALSKGLSWYQPNVSYRGKLCNCTIAMVEVRYPGTKAEGAPPGRGPHRWCPRWARWPADHEGCHDARVMRLLRLRHGPAPPSVDSGHDSVNPGLSFKGLSMGAYLNIEKVKAQVGCSLCNELVKAWKQTPEWEAITSVPLDPRSARKADLPTSGVVRQCPEAPLRSASWEGASGPLLGSRSGNSSKGWHGSKRRELARIASKNCGGWTAPAGSGLPVTATPPALRGAALVGRPGAVARITLGVVTPGTPVPPQPRRQ